MNPDAMFWCNAATERAYSGANSEFVNQKLTICFKLTLFSR